MGTLATLLLHQMVKAYLLLQSLVLTLLHLALQTVATLTALLQSRSLLRRLLLRPRLRLTVLKQSERLLRRLLLLHRLKRIVLKLKMKLLKKQGLQLLHRRLPRLRLTVLKQSVRLLRRLLLLLLPRLHDWLLRRRLLRRRPQRESSPCSAVNQAVSRPLL